MKKLIYSLRVSVALTTVVICLFSWSLAFADNTQLTGVNVSSVRVNDKDNPEFVGWYGVICVNAQPAGDYGNCGTGKVYCVTEGEDYGRGMVAIAMSALLSGKKVNIRSTGNQCVMIELTDTQ